MNARHYGIGLAFVAGYSYPAKGRGPAR